jgi:hypothetical protein
MPRVRASRRWATRWGESSDGLGEVVAEAHLAFEVGEQRLDGESDAGLFDLDRWALPEPVALRGDELDLCELEDAVEFASPQSLVAEQDAAGMAAGQLDDRFALLTGLRGRPGRSRPGRP